MRKWDVRDWMCRLYGKRVPGTLELAWMTSADREMDGLIPQRTTGLFLDCSKCYERVRPAVAAERAVATGCPVVMVNLVIGLYQQERYIWTNGAFSRGFLANSGLMAGCSFARDFLKAFLTPGLHLVPGVRDYVDDLVLVVKAPSVEASADLLRDLGCRLKNWLQQNHMVLNESKEQIWAPTAAMRKALLALPEFAQANIVSVVKDLGVDLRMGNHKDVCIIGRVALAGPIGVLIGLSPQRQLAKGPFASQISVRC